MSDFDTEIINSYVFQGQVNAMANSLEIIIDKILEDQKITPKKLLSGKVGQLKEIISDDNLISELIKFNKTWNITKHGKMTVGLKEHIMFRKDKGAYVFTKERQEEISENFTNTMKKLINETNNPKIDSD